MKASRINRFTSLMTVAFMMSGSAFALNDQWDVNDSTTGLGGTGTWDSTSLFWDDLASGANDDTETTVAVASWNPGVSAESVTFGGTNGTVTLNQSVRLTDTSFTTAGYILKLTNTTVTVSTGTLTRAAAGDNDSSASIVNGGTLILANTAANATSGVREP